MGIAYSNVQSSTGTCTLTIPAGAPGTTFMLTALSVSMAGPTNGPNGKCTIYDGSITGTVLHAEFLPGPGTGSVGNTVEIKIPLGPDGKTRCLQGTPGNAMTIVVDGTGVNRVSINARISDGLS